MNDGSVIAGAAILRPSTKDHHQLPQSPLCSECLGINFDGLLSFGFWRFFRGENYPPDIGVSDIGVPDIGVGRWRLRRGHDGELRYFLPPSFPSPNCAICRIFEDLQPAELRSGGISWHRGDEWAAAAYAYVPDSRWTPKSLREFPRIAREFPKSVRGTVAIYLAQTKSRGWEVFDKYTDYRYSPVIMFPVDPPSKESMSSTLNWKTVRGWIQECYANHLDDCKHTVTHPVTGLRLIDCADPRVPQVLQVDGENPEYITLSYVWGGEREEPLTKSGLPTRLPRTIHDAVRTVHALGHRYLWVDRYCIPQDDEAQRLVLISRMGDIYANSVLTIVAAAGNGPRHGLPGVGRTARSSQSHITIGSKSWMVQRSIKLESARLDFSGRAPLATKTGLHRQPGLFSVQRCATHG